MTTFMIVRHFRTPSAYDASRSSSATTSSISSVDRTTTGIIRTLSAKAAAKPVLTDCSACGEDPRVSSTNKLKPANANKPATIEGIPVITSTKNRIRSEEHTSELQSRGHLVCRL